MKPEISLEGNWEVTELMSKDVQTLTFPGHLNNTPYFEITKTMFSGYDGCNTFSGVWEIRTNKVKLDKGAQTLMACIGTVDGNPIDYIFNEAISRNPIFESDGNGTYSIVTNLSAELRDWNVTADGYLELIKSGKVVLKAKPKL